MTASVCGIIQCSYPVCREKIRIHSSLGYKTIEEFEIEMFNQKVAA